MYSKFAQRASVSFINGHCLSTTTSRALINTTTATTTLFSTPLHSPRHCFPIRTRQRFHPQYGSTSRRRFTTADDLRRPEQTPQHTSVTSPPIPVAAQPTPPTQPASLPGTTPDEAARKKRSPSAWGLGVDIIGFGVAGFHKALFALLKFLF